MSGNHHPEPSHGAADPAGIEFRVGGIALREGLVLSFWVPAKGDYRALPGGHIEVGEDARQALEREMREEFGIHALIGRFRFVIENRFTQSDGPHQEVCIYFEMEVTEEELRVLEDHLEVEWLPRERWGELRPALLERLIETGRGHYSVMD